MKAKKVSDKIVRQIALDYVNYPYITMAELGLHYDLTRGFVSKLLHRAVEESIVTDDVARKIMERAAGNASSHAGEAGSARVRKAFEKSFSIRAKRKEELQNPYKKCQKTAESSEVSDNSTGVTRYVEPKVEQLSMFPLS